ncbi:transmembrane protein 186 isoform X1 [Phascolarctos cinereus]|uniref:Transmembrane protein 186 n=2 Tax=Phascolarctos cinereus TaxID=38626 RepID=A0A6P5J5H4_PHACI|nr:transmembrane protein 186 isoform X1 [Phascolarctos cinereus]
MTSRGQDTYTPEHQVVPEDGPGSLPEAGGGTMVTIFKAGFPIRWVVMLQSWPWFRKMQVPSLYVGRPISISPDKPSTMEAEKFQMIYRFPGIRFCGSLSRVKILQTGITMAILPPGYYCYMQGLIPLDCLFFTGGVASFALAMLYWISHFFRRLVGILYVNEAGTVLRVAHLTFWGRRQDTYCPVANIIPVSETSEHPFGVFLKIRQYDGDQTFYLTLRFGHILDKKCFVQVFGNLDGKH